MLVLFIVYSFYSAEFKVVLEKMEDLIKELQQDKGMMGKAWDFGRAMLGQDPIRDKLQEIDKDLDRLSRVAILRIHVS